MKDIEPNRLVSGLVACLVAAMVVGCSREGSTTSNGATNAPGALATAVEAARTSAQQAAAQVKEVATKVGRETAIEVDSLRAQAQGVLDRARSLAAEKKYSEALSSLKQLADLKLTPENQRRVDDLKAQIQKLMSSETVSNALGAAANLLR